MTWYIIKSLSVSVRLYVRQQLVKLLITFESHGIFGSNLAYLYILTLSSHWYANDDKASPSISSDWTRSFSEKAHNS